MTASITVEELQRLLEEKDALLIDVMLPEDFALRHIEGATQACVYEMVFLDRVAELTPDKERRLVVYDSSGATMAARTAREKLLRAGYRNVSVLEGGLEAWQAAGCAVTCAAEPVSVPTVVRGTYVIDPEQSVVEWTGRNINNRHYGRIAIASGEVVLEHGLPISGRFVLDMTTITNQDLQDEGWRAMLIRHLSSDDFFDVAKYPTATFTLIGSTPRAACTPGTPNAEISGSLTIKETSRLISFPAIIALQDDGSVKAQAELSFDRTLWDVCYGSGKLYERLGMHLVNDLVSVELFITARNAAD